MSRPDVMPDADLPQPVPPVDVGVRAGSRRRWTIAVLAALGTHLLAVFLLDVPLPEIEERPAASSRLAWTGRSPNAGGTVLAEQLLIFDNAPLFLPTTWNSAAAENVMATGRSPSEIFDNYEPRLTVAAGGAPGMLALLPDGVDSVRGGLGMIRWDTLSHFGRADRDLVQVDERLAQIEVHDFATGGLVLARAVARNAVRGWESWPDWMPFELLLEVDEAGTSAPPLVVPRGSGSEAVDSFFQGIVARELRLDVRLGPGYYRIIIGP